MAESIPVRNLTDIQTTRESVERCYCSKGQSRANFS